MAFPTTPIIDDFNRPDESPATGYTTNPDGLYATGNIKVVSNAAVPVGTPTTDAWCYYNVAQYGPNAEVYATDPTQLGSFEFYIGAPIGTPSLSGYGWQQSALDTFQLVRVDNAVATVLGSTIGVQHSAGDSCGLRVLDGVISFHHKHTPAAWIEGYSSRSDATYQQVGNIYFYISAANNGFDNLGGGTITTQIEYGRFVNPGFPLAGAS